MKKNKKIIAVFLSLCLCASLFVGCGQKSPATIKEVMQGGASINHGTFRYNISSTTTMENATYSNPTYTISGYMDNSQYLISFEREINGQKETLENVLFITSDTIYVKVAPILDYLAIQYNIVFQNKSYTEKWIQIPLNNAENITDIVQSLKMSIFETFGSVYEEFEVTTSKNLFTQTFDGNADVTQFFDKMAMAINANKTNWASRCLDIYKYTTTDEVAQIIQQGIINHMPEDADTDNAKDTPFVFELLSIFSSFADCQQKDMLDIWNLIQNQFSSLSNDTQSASNSVVTHTLSCKKNEYEHTITYTTTNDKEQCCNIEIVYKDDKSVSITPPDSKDIEMQKESIIIATNILTDMTSASSSQELLNDEETYQPEYMSAIDGSSVIRIRKNELFNEKITYHINENTGVDNITISIETYDAIIHAALVDYYQVHNYQITFQDASGLQGANTAFGMITCEALSQAILQYAQYKTPESLLQSFN